jgi:hypothetical protein
MRSLIVAAVIVSTSIVARAQQKPMSDESHHMATTMTKMKMMTTSEKIANAMSAAPSSISGKATILDWPAKEGDKLPVLRMGSNGWSCLPDMPDTEGNDPACLDEPWMQWVDAYMSKKTPALTHVGVGYMTAPGGSWGSNTNPYAMQKTMDNHWGHHNPHLMILVPDVKSLEGMSTDPNDGGPYVMYAGTPYAHIMAPIRSGATSAK